MPQHATAEEGEPARRLLLAVAAAFPRLRGARSRARPPRVVCAAVVALRGENRILAAFSRATRLEDVV